MKWPAGDNGAVRRKVKAPGAGDWSLEFLRSPLGAQLACFSSLCRWRNSPLFSHPVGLSRAKKSIHATFPLIRGDFHSFWKGRTENWKSVNLEINLTSHSRSQRDETVHCMYLLFVCLFGFFGWNGERSLFNAIL